MTQPRTRALHPMPGLAWTQLRNDAVAFASGWPVLPGAYQVERDGRWLGKSHTAGLEPIADIWTMAATTDPTVAADWWTQRPYSVLLSCGITVDAFEIAKGFVDEGLERLGDMLGPVAVTPFGALLVFAYTGAVAADRILRPEVRWHSQGAWVPLPPTARDGVPYRWRRAPHVLGWRIPSVSRVLRALSEAAPESP